MEIPTSFASKTEVRQGAASIGGFLYRLLTANTQSDGWLSQLLNLSPTGSTSTPMLSAPPIALDTSSKQPAPLNSPAQGAAGGWLLQLLSPPVSTSTPKLPSGAQPWMNRVVNPTYAARAQVLEDWGTKPLSRRARPYQFGGPTAKQHGLNDPYDPVAAHAAAQPFTADSSRNLSTRLNRAPDSAPPRDQGAPVIDQMQALQQVAAISGHRKSTAADDVPVSQPSGTEEHPFELSTELAHLGLGRWGGVPGRLLIGAAHGGLDVPANSIAEGGAWLGDFFNPGLFARTRASVANAEQDYQEAVGDSTAAKIGDIGGSIATAILTPELRLMKGTAALPLAIRGAQSGVIYGAEQRSAHPELPLWLDLALNSGAGAVGGHLAHHLATLFHLAPAFASIIEEGIYEFPTRFW